MAINDDLITLFIEHGYTPLEKFIDKKNKNKCLDNDGYIVYTSVRNIKENKIPHKFNADNPDVINNIKHYIYINDINVELISDTFVNAKSNLKFKCKCGRYFWASWSNFYSKNKHQCNICSCGYDNKILPYDVVVEKLKNNNLYPLFTEDEYLGVCSTNAPVQNDFGYKAQFKSWFIEREQYNPAWFHKSNPYTIENINLFLKYDTDDEYKCISPKYYGKNSDLTILHKTCGNTFNSKWENLYRKKSVSEPNRHGTRCPYCTGLRYQSLHAVVLKQLFLKLKDGTIIEDPSCRNPTTNCILPTDIVNHKEKIAIEIQSWFHDKEEQKIKDKIKKEFWEKHGYQVYTPDIRCYSVLEMAQLFFPEMTEIPKWVKYNFDSKLNLDVAQDLLNSGLLVSDVALEMGVSTHRIYDNIYHKKLTYPINYPNRDLIKSEYIINQQVTVQTAG